MRRFAAAVLSVLGLLAFAGPAAAAYPDRNVTIVVPYPAGGPTDQLARVVAEKLSKKFGQNFIVENVTGGSTICSRRKKN
jgi:tripartite-type tricarboxylate transporter receptor subunit TctC